EEDRAGVRLVGYGEDCGAEGAPLRLAVVAAAGEFDPQVAQRGGVGLGGGGVPGLGGGAPFQHEPAQAGPAGAGGVETAGVSVKEEGQQHFQGFGFPCPVTSAQEQAPVPEFEDVVVVLPDVVDPGTFEPVALGEGGVLSHRPSSTPYRSSWGPPCRIGRAPGMGSLSRMQEMIGNVS